MKANHNIKPLVEFECLLLSNTTKIQNESESQLQAVFGAKEHAVIKYDKDTK